MRYFFFFLLFLIPFVGISQTIDIKFDGSVTNYDISKKEGGVTIAIIQNGATVSSATSSSNGRYSLKGKIDVNAPFEVVFTKSTFVSKRINFNLKGINLEDSPAGELKPIEALDMELFAERPGVDFSFLNTQPVGKFTWNTQGYASLDQAGMKAMSDKINKLLKDSEIKAQQNEIAYNTAVAAADKAYAAKDYVVALAKYEEATRFKPKEQHPINRITEIDAILQKQKENDLQDQQNNAAYNNLITAADNFFKAGDYAKAKDKYYEASDISDEQYPLDQIKEIARLVKEKENEVKYKQLIESADLMVKQKSFKSARDNYAEASKLKPNEQYPKDKIKELDDQIKGEEAQAAKKAQYEELVAKAEALMKAEKWEEAKVDFTEALKLEPASTYVSGQIDIINKKLADIKAEKEKAEKIATLIQDGNKAMIDKAYDASLLKFKEVLTLDASNATATEKIAEINTILADLQKNKELNDKFDALVKQGDDLATAKKYADALTKYKEAIALKEDAGVNIKIQDVEKKLGDETKAAELEAQFATLVKEGAAALTAKDLTTALSKYEAALEIKPTDAPTTAKITEIKQLISDQQASLDKQQKIERLIQEGTELMEGGVMDGVQLQPAKEKFNEVLAIDPANAIAKAKIVEIDKLLQAEKELAEKENKFQENVQKGDNEVSNSEWTKAIGFYNVALSIKEDADVRQKLTNAQSQLEESAKSKQLELDYQKAIKEGTENKAAKKYAEALAKFEIAKSLKPSEQLPQDEIAAINALLADQSAQAEKTAKITSLLAEGETAFTAKDLATAKSKFEEVQRLDAENATAKKRLADIEAENAILAGEAAKNAQIAQLIQEGTTAFTAENYDNASAKFKEVLALDANNATAKKYIADIATKLNEQKLAAELDAKFNEFVAQGDNAVSQEKWQDAVTAYTQALALKQQAAVQQKKDAAQAKLGELSAEQEINNKYTAAITSANSLRDQGNIQEAIAKYTEAKTIKPSETYPQTEIDKLTIELQDKAKNNQATELIAQGNSLLAAKDYLPAKAKFEQVLQIDGSNAIALSKIAEIDGILAAELAGKEAEQQFNTFKANGLTAFTGKDYNNAMLNFEAALKIKDDAEIRNTINEILALRSQESQKAEQIATLLGQGKTAVDQKQWDNARSLYNEVLAIDPSNTTAKSQLALIETEIAAEKGNAEQMAEFNRLKEQGYAEFVAGQLESAKHSLESALRIQSNGEVSQKLSEINNQIAAKVKAEQVERDYKAAIEAAEISEAASNFENALAKYKEANILKSNMQLPKDKIAELTAIINEKNAANAVETQFATLMSQGDELMSAQKYAGALAKFQEAATIKPSNEEVSIKIKLAQKAIEEAQKNASSVAFENLIQDIQSKINEKNTAKAKELVAQATAIQANDPRLNVFIEQINQLEKEDKEFVEYMKQGSTAEGTKNYQEAISAYEKAKLVKPYKQEPVEKINQLRSLMEAALNENNKATIYQQYYDAGIANMQSSEYEIAINNFRNALNAKPNDANALAKIAEAEKQIAQLELLNKQKSEADQAFNKIVLEADEYFNSNNYQKAAETYRQALAVRPEHPYSKRQLTESERLNKLESINLLNQQYQKILVVADNHFKNKDYQKALEYYKRALTIKSNDQYPKLRIDEINGILNPVAESSDELKPLGDPFDGSILDGETALLKAEEQRKDAKRTKVKRAEEKAILSSEQMLSNKNAELTETINSIYNLYTKLIVDEKLVGVDKLAISQHVTSTETRKFQVDTENQMDQHQNVMYTQDQMNTQTDKIKTDYDVSTAKQYENHIDVERVRVEEQNKSTSLSISNHGENVQVDEKITTIENTIAENTVKSNDLQVETAIDIDVKRQDAENLMTSIDQSKHNELIGNKQIVENTYSKVKEDSYQSERQLVENNTKIQTIDQGISDRNIADQNKNHHEAINVKHDVNTVVKKSTENDIKQTAQLVENNEKIKEKAGELAVAADNKTMENSLKNNETKDLVTEAEKKNLANHQKASDVHKDKVNSVKAVENSTTVAINSKEISDNQERLNTQRDIEIKKEEKRQRELEEAARSREKAEQVKETEKGISTTTVSQNAEKNQSILDAKKEMDKIEVKPVQPAHVPNSLGEKYPEGVSQEIFQRKDEAGILSAIITRRIVVLEGRGNEYVRTQTTHATTYSKNGKPITEHVWQKETQDARLQRHY